MDTSSQPYKYFSHKPDHYTFTTDRGAEYECYFISAVNYFASYPDIAEKVFMFNIDLVSKPVMKGIDYRIQFTVVDIVANFLASRINAVVYVCDPSEGRDGARFKKFKSWYFFAEHPSHQIQQVVSDVDAGGITLHTALLVHKKNPQKQRFVDAYFALTQGEK
jgi:hypothetical protein